MVRIMNEILQHLLVNLVALPLVWLILRLIFKGSMMFKFSLYVVVLIQFIGIIAYFQSHTGIYWTIGLIVTNVLASALVFYKVNQSLRRPLSVIIGQLAELANGNLDIEITTHYSNDELGLLANLARKLQTNLKDIITKIHHTSFNVEDVSQLLNKFSGEVSYSSNEQASSLEEISSTMEEMASTIVNNSNHSKQTAEFALQVIDEIKSVAEAAENSLKAVAAITDEVSIVKELALQTNILSLNASVEAARAGTHGRGFGVVAKEIQKLADKSKMAANRINEKAAYSLDVTYFAGEMFKEVVPKIEKTTHLIQEISTASIEQTLGVEQVNSALQQLNSISQRSAIVSDEMNGSSNQLLNHINHLKKDIQKFNVAI